MDSSAILVILIGMVASVLTMFGIFFVLRRFINPGALLLGLPLPEEISRLIEEARAEERAVRDVEVSTLRSEIAELRDRVEWLMQLITERKQAITPLAVQPPAVALPGPVNYRQMLVAVGDEPGLKIDLAIFRRNRILFERLNPVTLAGFEAMINRGKRAGRGS